MQQQQQLQQPIHSIRKSFFKSDSLTSHSQDTHVKQAVNTANTLDGHFSSVSQKQNTKSTGTSNTIKPTQMGTLKAYFMKKRPPSETVV
jgi:hypothetical protein